MNGLGSFPVPSGATGASLFSCGKFTMVEFGHVTPAQSSSFYSAALPAAGYTITLNGLSTDPAVGASLELMFNGHGHAGSVSTTADVGAGGPSASASALPFDGKNVTDIMLEPGTTLTDPGSC